MPHRIFGTHPILSILQKMILGVIGIDLIHYLPEASVESLKLINEIIKAGTQLLILFITYRGIKKNLPKK